MNKLLSDGNTIPQIFYPIKKHDVPSVDYIRLEAGQTMEHTLFFTEIILLTEGELYLSYDHFLDYKVHSGKILLLPPGCHFTVRTGSCVSVLIFRMKEAIRFCEEHSADNMPDQKIPADHKLNFLELKPIVGSFVSSLKDSMNSGLLHEEYLRLKSEELLYLLHFYYSTEELREFFLPL